jgi:hypothetical protein
MRIPKIPKWLADWGWLGLLIAAVTFEEAKEYGIALMFAILAALSLVAVVIYWGGMKDSPRLTLWSKGVGIAASIVLCVVVHPSELGTWGRV